MLLILANLASALPPPPDDPDALALAEAMERMAKGFDGLRDCSFTFRSQEYVNGSITEWSTASVLFRGEEDIYMEFTAGPNSGRKLLYRGPNWNNGKFRIDPGAWLPVMSLHPEGKLATRGSRHTLRDLPLPKLGAKIVRDALKVRDHAKWLPRVRKLGEETIGGRKATCYESELPKAEDASLYAYRVEMCLDQGHGLPARLKVWDHEDGEVRLIESYEYIDLRVNAGLTDADFDPETHGL